MVPSALYGVDRLSWIVLRCWRFELLIVWYWMINERRSGVDCVGQFCGKDEMRICRHRGLEEPNCGEAASP